MSALAADHLHACALNAPYPDEESAAIARMIERGLKLGLPPILPLKAALSTGVIADPHSRLAAIIADAADAAIKLRSLPNGDDELAAARELLGLGQALIPDWDEFLGEHSGRTMGGC